MQVFNQALFIKHFTEKKQDFESKHGNISNSLLCLEHIKVSPVKLNNIITYKGHICLQTLELCCDWMGTDKGQYFNLELV